MRLSELFTKTRRDAPAEETAKNAQLLIKAGYIHKEMAGVYAYLPLGLRVVENIKNIVREEMNAIGGQELIMTTLQRKQLWEKTDRWDDSRVDIWLKSRLQAGGDVGLAWSHEEPITDMMKSFIASYRDLPIRVYQFQTKLRNELRAKSGVMRGREFVMKDLYSYFASEAAHRQFYDQVAAAYMRVFERVGLGELTYFTFASGGAFTQFSHEFQTVTEAGEDTIYLDRRKKIAVNQEVLSDDVLGRLGLNRADLEVVKAAEVGNIFSFGGAKSEQLGLYFTDEDGQQKPVILGSYGIGITRLVGVIVEHFADEKGLVWPRSVAPYVVHLISLENTPAVTSAADALYAELTKQNIAVIYDNRDQRAGEKFADADLLGVPFTVLVSERAVGSGKIELKERATGVVRHVAMSALVKFLRG